MTFIVNLSLTINYTSKVQKHLCLRVELVGNCHFHASNCIVYYPNVITLFAKSNSSFMPLRRTYNNNITLMLTSCINLWMKVCIRYELIKMIASLSKTIKELLSQTITESLAQTITELLSQIWNAYSLMV
jgi:hypothetical protein